jgi:hypothetical protein
MHLKLSITKIMCPRRTTQGFAGGFFFELNDDLLPNDTHFVMRWHARGLAGGAAVSQGQINNTK